MKQFKLIAALSIIVILATTAAAQVKARYNYVAQKALIPAELGPVYLGMSLKDFSKTFDLTKAEVDRQFGEPTVTVPFVKGDVIEVAVKVHGLTDADKDSLFYEAKVMRKPEGLAEEVETPIHRIRPEKLTSRGMVYAIYVKFRSGVDLKKRLDQMYGKGLDRKPGDQYHFSDTEWSKKTSDGLLWLIRAFHKDDRSLQLLGRIPGTEWGLDGVN